MPNPNRSRPSAGLSEAVRADMDRRGLTIAEWARSEGVKPRTVEQWLYRSPVSDMAGLLARKIAAE